MINQWGNVANGTCAFHDCKEVDRLLSNYSFFRTNFPLDIVVLLLLPVTFYAIGFLGLLIRIKWSQ
ncbi:unnamed protein product [Dracunculus medinensis]|uniref:VKc domain-containing protein n=1 Tax=Dracunculus medinensis TaxID=318479 RepID=A0A0N4UNX6_DRAME|nr:unnamed protein product [Dracunculus medinensis]